MNSKVFIDLYNGCWKFEVFPNEWKKALVVTLVKSKQKDNSDLTFYRPICLLPILGKILEGVILRKIKKKCQAQILESHYGFMTKRSTEDAFHKFLYIQESQDEKYGLGIFLDISNAFNNLWWPAITRALKRMNCSKQLIKIIEDNLCKRLVIFKTEIGSIERKVNKGYTQGSILGPFLRNTVFNKLLFEFDRKRIRIVSFADDTVIIISGDTRKQLDEEGQVAMRIAKE